MNLEIINYTPFFNYQLSELFHNAVHNLCKSEYSNEQLFAWSPSGEVSSNKWISRISEDNCFVALAEGEIAGFIAVQKPNYIDMLYVHKDFKGNGIAKYMYNFAEDSILQESKRIYTYSSKTALPFFRKMGFEVEKPNKVIRLGIELENYLMSKQI